MEWKAVFQQVLNMSLTGSLVIGCVLLARLLLRRAPKVFSYALWAVVLFRLLCPVSLTSSISLLGLVEAPVTRTAGPATTVTYFETVVPTQNTAVAHVTPDIPEPEAAGQTPPENGREGITIDELLVLVWLAGTGIMALTGVLDLLRLRWRLIGAVRIYGDVYIADHIDTPFVLGLLRPRIYLPSDVPMKERRYIVAHERHHIRRADHILKLLAYGALCVHWFNPLVWVAFTQAGKDMEMSCDEAVIRKLGAHIRADYSASLLRLATGRRIIAGAPLAFGEGDTKGRVMNMAKWKKPKLWVSIICMVLCIVILVACALNPEKAGTFAPSQKESSALDDTRMDGPVSASLGDLYFTLPEGMSMQSVEIEHTGNAWDYGYAFYVGETMVGGTALRYQEQSSSADAFSREWQMKIGVPEAADTSMGYIGGGSIYGDFEITYFPDMPVNHDDNGNIIKDESGTYVLENEVTHYFLVNGTDVYDLWLYNNRLPHITQEQLLKSCYIEGVTDVDAMESAKDREDEALSKCRAVMEAVQNGSYKIVSRQINAGNEGPKGYERIYCRSGDDWLSVTNVLTEGENVADGMEYAATKSALYANGQRFSYTGTEWVEIANDENSLLPWLADFSWSDNVVAYMDTLTDEDGECVMLRVDEKYADSDENAPQYFVSFNFDLEGNFVNAYLQVNVFQDNAFTITESIVSMNSETVNAEIQKVYQNAVG